MLLRLACQEGRLSQHVIDDLERIRRACRELKGRFTTPERSFEAFPKLIDRVLALVTPAEQWFLELTDVALKNAEKATPAFLARVELLLAGKYDVRRRAFQRAKLPVFFDVADHATFACRVADPRMGLYFSRRLFATQDTAGAKGICSLTGEEMELETEKMPSALLPVLGDTILMSMNPDTPCQRRYGRTGTDVFRIGKKIATELNSALVQLTGPEREFKNWCRVPASAGGKSNLLLAYLDCSPLDDAEWASLLTEPQEREQYSEIRQKLSRALREIESHGSDRIEVLVLNKITRGQVQIELSGAFSARRVLVGGEEWEAGARNVPPIVFRRQPEVPFPSDVLRASRRLWMRGGKEPVEAVGCRLSQVYDLFIGGMPKAQSSARALLQLFVRRAGRLLAATAHAFHRGGLETWKGFSKEAKQGASTSVAVLGIALSKTNRRKEVYMQGPSYQLGRLCSLVDTLHREYCLKVRSRQLPPQLLGNMLLPTVLENPNDGVAHMLNRASLYQAWATIRQSGLARWTLGEMGKLMPIAPSQLPARLDDVAKAELLLGYLTRSEKGPEQD